MNEQIVPQTVYAELVNNPQVSEYIELAFQIIPLVGKALTIGDKALDLAIQLDDEKTHRLEIQEDGKERRLTIKRRMDQLDAELDADFENNKTVVDTSMRVFEKMVENGHIEQTIILHDRVISRLSGRFSIAAGKFNQNNPDGQVKFYTDET